jgi:hypothetical protein
MTNWAQVREINLFAAVLVVQSLPFLSAVAIAAIERSRLNSYATWQALETRARELILHRTPAIADASANASAPAKERMDEAA